jgi:hypothetical protein
LTVLSTADTDKQGMKADPTMTMRIRAGFKVVLIAMATNEVLTILFAEIARRIDPDLSLDTIEMFSFISAMLAGFWFQADAKRAYLRARNNGFIVTRKAPESGIIVRENCPQRWLVQLYLELNPSLVTR